MTSADKIKTGTTCIGMLFKDGVILAADRRSTAGYIASETTTKVFNIGERIVSTISGYASDAQLFMRIVQGELKLIELRNERQVRVKEAAMLLNSMQYSGVRTQGSVVGLILGGYDEKEGFALYNLGADGTISTHEGFIVDGSGSIFIKGVIQNEYKPDMSQKEAVQLIEKAFLTSFRNDNASGGGYIARVITQDGIKEIERKILKTELVDE